MSRLENNSVGSCGRAVTPTSLPSRLDLMTALQSVLIDLPSVVVDEGSVDVDDTVKAADLSVAVVQSSKAMAIASETAEPALDIARRSKRRSGRTPTADNLSNGPGQPDPSRNKGLLQPTQ